jgi:hypothetical protein
VFHLLNHYTIPLSRVLEIIAPDAVCVDDNTFFKLMAENMEKRGVAVLRFYLKQMKTNNSPSFVLIKNKKTRDMLDRVASFSWRYPSDAEVALFTQIAEF